MKGIILYESKYGATKEYAKMLSEKFGYDIRKIKEAKVSDLNNYDLVIVGGGIYATGIKAFSFLRKNFKTLNNKELIAFAVGASPFDERTLDYIRERNFNDEIRNLPLFYCRGAWNMENMSFIDKKMCQMLLKTVRKKDPKDMELWESALVEAGTSKNSWVDENNLSGLYNYIESLED